VRFLSGVDRQHPDKLERSRPTTIGRDRSCALGRIVPHVLPTASNLYSGFLANSLYPVDSEQALAVTLDMVAIHNTVAVSGQVGRIERSLCLRSVRGAYRTSCPSLQSRSNATNRASPRRKSRSRNSGFPSSFRHTISPSKTKDRTLSSARSDSLSFRNDLKSFPFRETRRHFPCSIRTSARKPSNLSSNSQSG